MLIALAAVAGLAHAGEPIDLDVAANLQALQQDRPDHYAKIQKFLKQAPLRAWNARSFETWMQIDFDATQVRSSDLIMTTYPPKKRLEFALDGTAYRKTVTLQATGNAQPVIPGVTLEGRDFIRAYTQAARAGDCRAALLLGMAYRDGTSGVDRDLTESAKWFNAARVLGCDVPPGGPRN